MESRVDVLCCGLVTLDVVGYVAAFPRPDEKVEATAARVDFGGPAANAARAAAQLGSSVRLVTMIGSGPIARMIRARLARMGIPISDVTPPDSAWQPSVSAVTVDGTGRRTVVSANAGNAPVAAAPEALPRASVALLDGHHLPTALSVAHRLHRAGAVIVLDGGSWKPGLEQLVPLVHVVVASADFRVPDPHAGMLANVPAVATTHGPDQIGVRIGDQEYQVPVPTVAAVDTLGAGDVLHGAFIHHLAQALPLSADSIRIALEQAAVVAADSCTRRGVDVGGAPQASSVSPT